MAASKLCAMALGLALGLMRGISVFIIGLIAHFADYGPIVINSVVIPSMHYGPSILGSVIAGLIAFVDAFIAGFILAWLYNLIIACNCISGKKDESTEATKSTKKGS